MGSTALDKDAMGESHEKSSGGQREPGGSL